MIVIFSITLIFITMSTLLAAKFNESRLIIYLGEHFNAYLFSLVFIVAIAGVLLYFFSNYWIWVITGVILIIGYLLWEVLSPLSRYITLSNITCLDCSKRKYSQELIETAYEKKQAIFEKHGDTIVKQLINKQALAAFINLYFLPNDDFFSAEKIIKKSFEINKLESQKQLISVIRTFQEEYNKGKLKLTAKWWLDLITLTLTEKTIDKLNMYSINLYEENLPHDFYQNLLEIAYDEKHYNLVHTLVDSGIKFKRTEEWQQKLFNDFLKSITWSNFEKAIFLLSAGFNINFKNEDGDTVLHNLCSINDYKNNDSDLNNIIEWVKIDRDLWKFSINSDDIGRREKSILDAIKFLVENGIDINLLDKHNRSPLALACSSLLNYDLIRSLIYCGADVNNSDSKNDLNQFCTIPLEIVLNNVIKENNVIWLDIAIHLLSSGATVECIAPNLLRSVVYSTGDYEFMLPNYDRVNFLAKTIQLIVNNGYPINQTIKNDYVGLQSEACLFNWIIDSPKGCTYDLVEFLIKSGAELNQAQNGGLTPLLNAIDKKLYNIAQLLIRSGVNVNQPASLTVSESGWEGSFIAYPLHFACEQEDLTIVKSLIDNGAEVNVQTSLETISGDILNTLYSTLMGNPRGCIGYESRRTWLVGRLIGYTPLHYACSIHRLDIIDYLLKQGADINLAANNGATPLMVACWNTNNYVIQHLIRKGAGVNIRVFKAKEDHIQEWFYPIKIYLKECRETKQYMLDTVKLLVDHGAKFHNQQDFDDIIELIKQDDFQEAKIIKDYLIKNQNLLIG